MRITVIVLENLKYSLFSGWVLPICLPFDAEDTYQIGELMTVAGWGYYEQLVARSSPVLKSVNIPLIPLENCKNTFE